MFFVLKTDLRGMGACAKIAEMQGGHDRGERNVRPEQAVKAENKHINRTNTACRAESEVTELSLLGVV